MKQLILFLLLFCSISFGQSELPILFDDDEAVYALDLNGLDENMTIATGVNIGTNHSILFWGNPSDATSTFCAIAGATTGYSSPLSLGIEDPGMYTHDGTSIQSVTTDALENNWHLYAMVRNGTNVKFYQDGVQVGTDKTLATNNALTITQIASRKAQYYFKGLFGEVQILTGSLDASETSSIKSSYNSATIQMWYKWQGKTNGEVLADHSGKNRNLTGNNVTTADQVKVGTKYK